MSDKPNRTPRAHRSKGVALVITLLLLSLFMIMTLAMVIATSSDTLIDGYFRDSRGSFYASDSGMNAARQYLQNQFQTLSVSSSYTPGSGTPFSSSTVSTVLSGLTDTSAGFGSYNTVVGSNSSWPGKFKVDATRTFLPNGTVTMTTITTGATTRYTYSYPYKITIVGNSTGSEQNTAVETGSINVTVPVTTTTTSGTTTSFASWGTLFNSYALCSAPFVKGTMTGPFFSNDSWNFGDNGSVGNGSYIFTGAVGAANANVGYMYSDGTCDASSATSDSHSVTTTSGFGRHQVTTTTTTTIAPQFQGGLETNQPAVPLPQDSFNQAMAVVNGLGGCTAAGASSYSCSAPSQAVMNSALKTASGTAYPSSGTPSSGVYVPYSVTTSGSTTTKTFTGGGLYIQGNADSVTLAAGTSGSDTTQIVTVKQGNLTTTVTLDLTAQTTTVTDTAGHNSGTINGLPMNYNNSPASEACMVYVTGGISGTDSSGNTTGLSGPSSGAAIPNGSAMTVTANNTIAITGNITYAQEPVTLTQSGSTPADTLITSPSTPTNVLGIFTFTGDIQLQPTNNVTNMEIDASLAMISNSGSGGLVAQWNSIGTLNIVGGRIANQAKSGASIGTRNIWFDKRFGANGFAPPWFPSTTLGASPVTTSSVGATTTTVSRQSWENITAE